MCIYYLLCTVYADIYLENLFFLYVCQYPKHNGIVHKLQCLQYHIFMILFFLKYIACGLSDIFLMVCLSFISAIKIIIKKNTEQSVSQCLSVVTMVTGIDTYFDKSCCPFVVENFFKVLKDFYFKHLFHSVCSPNANTDLACHFFLLRN